VPGAGARFFQALVDRETGTEDGGGRIEGDVLGDVGGMSGFGDTVLLECAVDGVARHCRVGTERLFRLLAEFTFHAGSVQPLDTCVIANLEASHQLAFGHNNPGTLVASDKRQLQREGPVTLHGMQICVTDT
jgi:hypothetical protein